MKKRSCMFLFAVAACACGGSGRDDDGPNDDGGPSPCASDGRFSTVTYNGGLAPGFMELATPRIPAVADAVASFDADVICLQEIWTAEGVAAVTASLEDAGYEVYVEDTSGENEDPADRCTADEIAPIHDCVDRECGDVQGEDVSRCAVERCQDIAAPLFFTARHCLNCILAQPGVSPHEVVHTCVEGSGASRLYGGRNSIMLASRLPMRDKEALRLPSSGANRVSLMATVDAFGMAPVEIGCTHLSANGAVPPTAGFADWDAERRAQFDAAAVRLTERADGGPTLFLGDMNFGPSNKQGLFDHALDEGFASPAAEVEPPLCSSCGNNTLREGGSDSLIDHVLTRDVDGVLAPDDVRRYATAPVTVTGHDGAPVVKHPSDHYGIGVTFACDD